MRLAIAVFCFGSLLSAQPDPSLDRLQREMARVARASGGIVGATAIHIETGRRVSLNPLEGFPMASTVKVPLAVKLLSLVDEGKLRLDQMVTIEQRDLHPGSGTISDLFNKGGLALSVRNLMELMLLISDNSATDVLLRLAGGGEAVTSHIRGLGINGLRADRPTSLLIADAVGLKLPPEIEWSPEVFRAAFQALNPAQRDAARKAFNDDPRDTSSPSAMAELLVRIHQKNLLKPDTSEVLLDIMRRCRTGDSRLKGLLPADTVVAHKTGTITNSANDVGILTLPDNAGHVALAVFVKKSERPAAQADRGIAEIARAVHDFFLFNPGTRLRYDKMADRIILSLKPQQGEKYIIRSEAGVMDGLVEPVRNRMRLVGAVETRQLDEATIYLWLPLKPGGTSLPAGERAALVKWTQQGGSRRQLHFHWGEGSVLPDGLYGEHTPALDRVYLDAIDVDYDALSTSQDAVITKLRSGLIRVKTPAGTNIIFKTGDRPFNKQDGNASADRMRSAKIAIDRDIELPSGVIRVAPMESSVNGVIVIPTMRLKGETRNNVRLFFTRGKITKAEGVELNELGSDDFREFALGMNPKLKAPGAVLPYYGYGEGVVRMSIGDNQEVGGNVKGGAVRWFFFPDATVEVNGQPVR